MRRRSFVSTVAASTAAAATGCLHGDGPTEEGPSDAGDDGEDGGGAREIPGIGDPPDGVYHPTHSDPMEMVGAAKAGDYEVSAMYSLPHRFWTLTGSRTERVDPTAKDDVHLMLVVSDAESGTVIPADMGVSVEVSKDGETVYDRNPWTMISQKMGFHFGDNVPLDGDGDYQVEVSLGDVADVTRTGELGDRFVDGAQTTFQLEFREDGVREMASEVQYFPEDRWGASEALSPMTQMGDGSGMQMDDESGDGGGMPYSSAPPSDELPGELLGSATSDDAVFAASRVPGPSRFADGDYLLVSPRTPYNRCVLPAMALELSTGEALSATLDSETGLVYGAPVETGWLEDGVEIEVVTPPQVSRHMGYETAFLEMDAVEVQGSGQEG